MKVYRSFIKRVGGAEGDRCNYPVRMDTYGKGCYFNCKYCYGKQILDFRKMWNPKKISVAPKMELLKIAKQIPSNEVVRLGGMTDCFQPIELEERNSYNLIKMLNKRKVHYLIVTKSTILTNEDYLKVLNKDLAHIQISISSTNDEVLRNTDNAPSFKERKECIEILEELGYDVSLRLSPFLYNTCDFSVLNKIKVDKCLVEFLRIKPSMLKGLIRYINFKDYNVKEGGYRHVNLKTKLYNLRKLKFKELSVCDDVNEHYNFFKNNINYNKEDCCNLRL